MAVVDPGSEPVVAHPAKNHARSVLTIGSRFFLFTENLVRHAYCIIAVRMVHQELM